MAEGSETNAIGIDGGLFEGFGEFDVVEGDIGLDVEDGVLIGVERNGDRSGGTIGVDLEAGGVQVEGFDFGEGFSAQFVAAES